MDNSPDFQTLFDEFPELAEPDALFEKEMLAHFGLLFSKYADLEAGIQNCYILWKQHQALTNGEIDSEATWIKHHDTLEARAFASTFGSLLRLVRDFTPITLHLEELTELKKKRDYFAHHFFREENSKMFSSEALLNLMSKMNELRNEVAMMEREIDSVYASLLKEMYPNKDMKAQMLADVEKLRDDYINNPPDNVGWEKNKLGR